MMFSYWGSEIKNPEVSFEFSDTEELSSLKQNQLLEIVLIWNGRFLESNDWNS